MSFDVSSSWNEEMTCLRRRQRRWFVALLSVAVLGSLASAWALPPLPVGGPPAAWVPAGWGGGGFYTVAAFDPKRDGVLYLGTDVSGVAKSLDHGKTFKFINTRLSNYAIYSLAVDAKNPDTLYAGTPAGLHKSSDGGATWAFVKGSGRDAMRLTSERNVSVRPVASDPTDSSIVYAASPGGQVYKSADGGGNWRLVFPRSASSQGPQGLAVQFGGVDKSYFGGVWWQVRALGAVRASGLALALKGDGSTPEKAFVIVQTAAGLVYRSRDVREVFAWTTVRDLALRKADFEIDADFAKRSPKLAASAPKAPEWGAINRVDVVRVSAPDSPSALWISKAYLVGPKNATRMPTLRDFEADKVVQSYGNVRLGTPMTAGAAASSVVVCGQRPSRVLAATSKGLLLSDDRGETWTALRSPERAMHAAFDPSNPDIIYGAFSEMGVHKSVDGGKTWTGVSPKVSAHFAVREVAVNPRRPNEVSAIGSDGWTGAFLSSADGGQTWDVARRLKADATVNPTLPQDSGTPKFSTLTSLTINPLNPRQIYVSANWRPAFSEDGGRTWEERVRGVDITVQTDIRFSGGRTYVSAMDEGALVSDDHGASWRQLWPLKYDVEVSGHVWRMAVNSVNGVDRIIATASPWLGRNKVLVAISEDGGKSFKTTTAGLPTEEIKANTMWGRGYPRALAVDPTNPKIVYLGIDGDPDGDRPGGGIFKSADGGYTWRQLPHQPGSRRMYYGLAVDPTNAQRIVWGACGEGGGVYISEDGGGSWRLALKQDTWIFNVHVAADGAMYAGGQALWKSVDHGQTWKSLTNLGGRAVVGIEVDPRDPRTIWISAITWGDGAEGDVYKTTDGGLSWSDVTGNLSYRKPQVLRFNPQTKDLWAGQNVLQRLRQ